MNNFPDITVPESKKDENWHKSFVTQIASHNLNSSYSTNQGLMESCYRYFDGTQNSDVFKYLQEAADGSQLPAKWMNINRIRSKVNLLVGELLEKGYDFDVKAINKEAKSKRLEAKERARVDIRLQPHLQELEEATGFPTQKQLPVQSEADLDEFFQKNYKEISEIVLYHALKYVDQRMSWDMIRTALFRDILIAGKCFVKVEINNGLPRARRIDPRNMIHDTYSENDFLTDSTYFGEVRYMNIADAAAKYQLSKEELTTSAAAWAQFVKFGKQPSRPNNFDDLGWINTSGQEWYRTSPAGLRVLVIEACWVDYKMVKFRVSKDSYGNDHFKRISDESKDKEDVVSRKIKIWRRATLIGGQFVKEWGEIPNQVRDVDSLSETYPPYLALIPHYVNQTAVSVVEQLKALQNLKDIITYGISLALSRAGAKGFIYDISQCPENWEPETVIKYLKTVGIAFIDSRQGGVPAQFNQFSQIDLSLSESVKQYLDLTMYVDREMDAVSGINDARQGILQGSSQGSGVTQAAVIQSSLQTAPYFRMFDQFSTNVFTQLAKLIKIAWAGKEIFAPIIGDAGVNFLKEDVELDLNDYGVAVNVTPKLLNDINSFHGLIMAGLQSGDLPFSDAMELLLEKDVKEGIRRYSKIKQRREKEAIAMQQQMAMQQEQAKQQAVLAAQAQQAEFNNNQAEIAAQRSMQQAQIDAQTKGQLQAAQNQADLMKELVSQRGDAKLQRDQAAYDLELEKAKPKKDEKKTNKKV